MTNKGEQAMTEEQRILEQYDTYLKAQYRSWANDFVKVARENKALLRDEGGHYVISIGRMTTAICRLNSGTKARRRIEWMMEKLHELVRTSDGHLARVSHGNAIHLCKPVTSDTEDNTDKAAHVLKHHRDKARELIAKQLRTVVASDGPVDYDYCAGILLLALEPVIWEYAPVPQRIADALRYGNQAPPETDIFDMDGVPPTEPR